MTDRNWELVPGRQSLVRERALSTGLGADGWYPTLHYTRQLKNKLDNDKYIKLGASMYRTKSNNIACASFSPAKEKNSQGYTQILDY